MPGPPRERPISWQRSAFLRRRRADARGRWSSRPCGRCSRAGERDTPAPAAARPREPSGRSASRPTAKARSPSAASARASRCGAPTRWHPRWLGCSVSAIQAGCVGTTGAARSAAAVRPRAQSWPFLSLRKAGLDQREPSMATRLKTHQSTGARNRGRSTPSFTALGAMQFGAQSPSATCQCRWPGRPKPASHRAAAV